MKLKTAINEAVANGFTTFISGMAPGTDLIAGKIVVELNDPNIRLICAVPFPGHSKPFGSKWKDIYKELTEKAAEVYCICEKYSSECFDLRDRWMVDRADMVIAAYNGMPGGTKKTVYYANMKGLPVKNILEVQENKASHD